MVGPGLARNGRKWGMSGEYLFHVITNEYYNNNCISIVMCRL